MKTLNIGIRLKKIPVWAFYQRCKNAACTEYAVWYHCTICNPVNTQRLSELIKSVLLYNRLNTSSVCNHVMFTHPCEYKASQVSTMVRCDMTGKRPLWSKGKISWCARLKKATHLSVVLVILWLILRNKTKVTYIRHHLRKTLWIWWQRHTHLYLWCIAMNSVSWYHRWIHSLLLFWDNVSQESWPPLSMRLSSLIWLRCLSISHMSSLAFICGCLSKMRRFSISAHHCAEIKKGQYHLGKTNTKGTYENNLSDSIIDIITKFNLEKKMCVMVELIWRSARILFVLSWITQLCFLQRNLFLQWVSWCM